MDVNITIIGAGAVGLAIAAELSKDNDGVFVLEKHHDFGQETSSRNSEVIHSGIYYPTNSLKARLCLEGNKLIYSYCDEKGVDYKKLGKLVVATSADEEVILQKVLTQSMINGVEDGKLLTQAEALALEPNIMCTAALHFPSTGIVDSHGLMSQLETDAIARGAQVVYKTEVVGITKIEGGYSILVKEENGEYEFTTAKIINAAGLSSDLVARFTGTYQPSDELYYWKGEYFAVGNQKNKLINRLIYPVPHSNTVGLGVHATLDMNHRMKLGPDATFLPGKIADYKVDKLKQKDFCEAARKYLPFVELDDLHPDQAGVRPKLQKPGDPTRDFVIRNEANCGHPNIVNLIGIESPGLTSCLAIAKMVREIL